MSLTGKAILALALLALTGKAGESQDTTAVARHGLALDTARVVAFRRVYDMVLHTRDSIVVLGQREVSLESAFYAGNAAWRLVESRTGAVPAAETLYVTPGMRPLQWFAAQRDARVAATFVGDTVFGAIATPGGRHSIVLAGRPDLLVSQAMIESIAGLLPLTAEWSDSAGVLTVDMERGSIIPSELSVIGEEGIALDPVTTRQAWVVAVRAEQQTVLFWIDKENGETYRVQQPVAPHVGTLLEFRRRSSLPTLN